MKIQESAENYLETILILSHRAGTVRSVDIANELDFSKPSVSIAMRNLRENGYIQVDAGGLITLLPKGLEIAERIYERHTFLTEWLISLGVSPAVAAEDACRRCRRFVRLGVNVFLVALPCGLRLVLVLLRHGVVRNGHAHDLRSAALVEKRSGRVFVGALRAIVGRLCDVSAQIGRAHV